MRREKSERERGLLREKVGRLCELSLAVERAQNVSASST